MTPEDLKKQKAISPGPWYLEIGNDQMPYRILTPLDKTLVAATIYKVDAEYIIDLERENTALSADLKQLHKEFTEQAIKIDEKNYKIQALTKALEDIQYKIHTEIERASKFEVLLEQTLAVIHEYSLSGIEDKGWRGDVYNLEQEIKKALKDTA